MQAAKGWLDFVNRSTASDIKMSQPNGLVPWELNHPTEWYAEAAQNAANPAEWFAAVEQAAAAENADGGVLL